MYVGVSASIFRCGASVVRLDTFADCLLSCRLILRTESHSILSTTTNVSRLADVILSLIARCRVIDHYSDLFEPFFAIISPFKLRSVP